MKGLIFLSVLCAFSMAYAETNPREQFIVEALTSRQTREVIQQYSNATDFTSTTEVEHFNDLDVLTLQGTRMTSGDIPCGGATLRITRSFQRSWNGMGVQAVFKGGMSVKDCPLKNR